MIHLMQVILYLKSCSKYLIYIWVQKSSKWMKICLSCLNVILISNLLVFYYLFIKNTIQFGSDRITKKNYHILARSTRPKLLHLLKFFEFYYKFWPNYYSKYVIKKFEKIPKNHNFKNFPLPKISNKLPYFLIFSWTKIALISTTFQTSK